MDKIIELLRNIRPSVDWESEKAIIDDGILDSFDMITFISELKDAFGITIELEHIEAENFNSVDSMHELLKKLGAQI